MNPSSDISPPPPEPSPRREPELETPLPSNWREALLTLISSRVALIQLESKQAAQQGARRAIAVVAVILCAFFTWALLLAGGIAAIATAYDCPWHWLALGAAALHLIAAILMANSAKSPAPPAFPVTRAEFQKDREWIENFQKPRKSDV